jgi:hypothetical protein
VSGQHPAEILKFSVQTLGFEYSMPAIVRVSTAVCHILGHLGGTLQFLLRETGFNLFSVLNLQKFRLRH